MKTTSNQVSNPVCDLVLETPVGRIMLRATDAGLCEVRRVRGRVAQNPRPTPIAVRAARALTRYFERGRLDDAVPLDLSAVTGFQRRVLTTLAREVGPGQVVSYSELARRAGSAAAVRAVGTCMAKNPLPIFVPCHRVVAKAGLGGFGWGLEAKRKLLAIEGRTV